MCLGKFLAHSKGNVAFLSKTDIDLFCFFFILLPLNFYSFYCSFRNIMMPLQG